MSTLQQAMLGPSLQPGQYISQCVPNTVGFNMPQLAAESKKDFEFCKDNEQVDWAKFTMWLRGFLSAIEGQNLTPENIGKIMEKLAYVDPDRKMSYTENPMEKYRKQMQELLDLQRMQDLQQNPYHPKRITPYNNPQWVYDPHQNPTYNPIPGNDQWSTTGIKVYCHSALSNNINTLVNSADIRNAAASAV